MEGVVAVEFVLAVAMDAESKQRTAVVECTEWELAGAGPAARSAGPGFCAVQLSPRKTCFGVTACTAACIGFGDVSRNRTHPALWDRCNFLSW
mmetsp:Transcript_8783/g.16713  ORF Transcript_8783/g.16713 Transcript_8783/m.16713 type:complete len:93 (-) Transcript_8783:707-985(-)